MKGKLLCGTACATLCLIAFGGPARSATLEDVMARLDKIEKENAELKAKMKAMQASRPTGSPGWLSVPGKLVSMLASPIGAVDGLLRLKGSRSGPSTMWLNSAIAT